MDILRVRRGDRRHLQLRLRLRKACLVAHADQATVTGSQCDHHVVRVGPDIAGPVAILDGDWLEGDFEDLRLHDGFQTGGRFSRALRDPNLRLPAIGRRPVGHERLVGGVAAPARSPQGASP